MEQSEAVKVWEQVRAFLGQQNETRSAPVEAFLSELDPQVLVENEFVLSTKNLFVKQWIESRYLPSIKEAVFGILGRDCMVRIVIADEEAVTNTSFVAPPPPAAEVYTEESPLVSRIFATSGEELSQAAQNVVASKALFPQPSPSQTASQAMPPVQQTSSPLPLSSNQEQHGKTFDSFVVGESNRLTFNIARGVAEAPGTIYNPFFIYGKSGLGKTHLLLAIKDYVNRNQPHLRVVYAPTPEFVDDFTAAVRSGDQNMTDFSIKYRTCDVLLLDDVQYLEGKEATTNALFDIFNRFIAENKQVVLSADRAPSEINLDERYTSRFAQGGAYDIQPPTFETKLAIFNNYIDYCCRNYGKNVDKEGLVPKEVASSIVGLSSSNIRELEGAAMRLFVYMTLERPHSPKKYQSLTAEEAELIVEKSFIRTEKRVDVRAIQQNVEEYYGISHSDLIGAQRSQNISNARHIAMYLARTLTNISLPEIGKAFGGKDHTSVLYACRNTEKKYAGDPEKRYEINFLKEQIMS